MIAPILRAPAWGFREQGGGKITREPGAGSKKVYGPGGRETNLESREQSIKYREQGGEENDKGATQNP